MLEWICAFDKNLLLFLQQYLRTPLGDALFPIITALGNYGLIWILICVALLFTKRYRRWGGAGLCAMLLCMLVGNLLLKNLICRPRPFVELPQVVLLIEPPYGFSFPSGHSSSSFAAAWVLLRARRSWGIAALVLAALIAFSRMYLFAHYFTDVLAGAALGIGLAELTMRAFSSAALARVWQNCKKAIGKEQ